MKLRLRDISLVGIDKYGKREESAEAEETENQKAEIQGGHPWINQSRACKQS